MLVALLFTGCLSRPALVRRNFTFSTPANVNSNSASKGPVLAIHRLTVAASFDTQSLTYRTGEFSYEQDPYAQFLVPPAESLAEPVRAWLRQSGLFRDVAEPGSALRPNQLVEITVEQLYGDFRSRAKPSAVVGMRFVFFHAPEGIATDVLLKKDYIRRVPLTGRTATALMAGWNEALREIMDQLASDLRKAGV